MPQDGDLKEFYRVHDRSRSLTGISSQGRSGKVYELLKKNR